jgi:hypothetical protein
MGIGRVRDVLVLWTCLITAKGCVHPLYEYTTDLNLSQTKIFLILINIRYTHEAYLQFNYSNPSGQPWNPPSRSPFI